MASREEKRRRGLSAVDPLDAAAELLGEREQAFGVIVLLRARGARDEARVGRHNESAARAKRVVGRLSFNFELENAWSFHGRPLS